MATFSKTTFNAARYATIRPTYPAQLYDTVFGYYDGSAQRRPQARTGTVVDLGCGTGQVTRELAPRFERVVAVDPSSKMLDQAREALSKDFSNLSFAQATAETLLDKLPELEGQVDLITAAQAAHWFKYPEIYGYLKRLLRPSTGVFTFWGYSEFRFSEWEQLSQLIREYSNGSDAETSLGPHWEQPGRSIVDGHFDPVPLPREEDGFRDVKRIWYTAPHHQSTDGSETLPSILKKKTTWAGLEEYLRTFSSIHTYHERYPEDKKLKKEDLQGEYKSDEGDIAQRFLGRCQDVLRSEGIDLKGEATIEWPLVLFLGRRT